MDAFNQLESLLGRFAERARGAAEVGEAEAARQSLSALHQELEATRQARQRLAAENLQLKARVNVLERQVATLQEPGSPAAPADEPVEHLGAVFLRKPGGRILDTPLCRQCRRPLKAIAADVPYSCPACQLFALFRPAELNDVLLTLRR